MVAKRGLMTSQPASLALVYVLRSLAIQPLGGRENGTCILSGSVP